MAEATLAGDQTGAEAPTGGEEQTGQRPEGLPEKFDSVEALASSYAELEKKLGEQSGGDQTGGEENANGDQQQMSQQQMSQQQAEETAKQLNLDPAALSAELAENDGKFTDETYAKLEEAGWSREIVDRYVAGETALANAAAARVFEQAGGEEQFEVMRTWAAQNYTPEQQAAFDAAMRSGDAAAEAQAITALKATYEAKVGNDPTLVTGDRIIGDGPRPYASQAEMVQDMMKPEYKTDPAFRAKVEKRIDVSPLWG